MPFTTAILNAMLDSLTIDALSLHDGDPGQTGANEISGGSYARVAPTLAAAANGQRVLSNQPSFNVPAGASLFYLGFWEGAIFLGSADIVDVTYNNDGTYTITSGALSIS